jgi:hypothetical protein
MHRHLQFGMRENPASDRRHGSRLAADTRKLFTHSGEDDKLQPSPIGQNECATTPNAAHNAARGQRNKTTEPSPTIRRSLDQIGHSFEPLIGSTEAARLLGKIHVKTLQRYARLGC